MFIVNPQFRDNPEKWLLTISISKALKIFNDLKEFHKNLYNVLIIIISKYFSFFFHSYKHFYTLYFDNNETVYGKNKFN